MSQTFPIFDLPENAFKIFAQQLGDFEYISLLMCSSKFRNLTKSLPLRPAHTLSWSLPGGDIELAFKEDFKVEWKIQRQSFHEQWTLKLKDLKTEVEFHPPYTFRVTLPDNGCWMDCNRLQYLSELILEHFDPIAFFLELDASALRQYPQFGESHYLLRKIDITSLTISSKTGNPQWLDNEFIEYLLLEMRIRHFCFHPRRSYIESIEIPLTFYETVLHRSHWLRFSAVLTMTCRYFTTFEPIRPENLNSLVKNWREIDCMEHIKKFTMISRARVENPVTWENLMEGVPEDPWDERPDNFLIPTKTLLHADRNTLSCKNGRDIMRHDGTRATVIFNGEQGIFHFVVWDDEQMEYQNGQNPDHFWDSCGSLA